MRIEFLYLFGTILFTTYGQLILKWRIAFYPSAPEPLLAKTLFLLKLFLDPLIASGFFAAFLAALCWMAAIPKFELSFAYPFMSLSFVLVFVFSAFLFHESVSVYKVVGLSLILLGILVTSRSLG